MNNSIENALNDAGITETSTNDITVATDQSALAILYCDTAHRLAALMLGQENRARKNLKQEPLVPGVTGLFDGFQLIPGFHTYFVEAVDDEDGQPQWVSGNKVNLRSVYFEKLEKLTGSLLEYATEIKDLDMRSTAIAIVQEREHKDAPVPDGSGPILHLVEHDLAEKVIFYGGKLISILRRNGGSREFAPRSSMTLNDFLMLQEIELEPSAELGEVDESIDHPELRDSSPFTIGSAIQRKTNIFRLDPQELDIATNLKEVFEGWLDAYNLAAENNDILSEEINYQREQAAEYVKTNRASNPIRGVARSA